MGTLNELQNELENLRCHINDMNQHLKWALSIIPCEEEEHKEKWEKAKNCLREGSECKIRIHSISYDLDDEEDGVDLPKELEITLPPFTSTDDAEELASETISDETGFCHKGFKWNYIN